MRERLINCGHHPELFIPGVTTVPEVRQDEAENAKTYDQSQKQRGLEREFRKARLDVRVAKEQGDEAGLKAAREKLKAADEKLGRFEKETGRRRRREREYAPVAAKWPKPTGNGKTAVRDALRDYFENGGVQSA